MLSSEKNPLVALIQEHSKEELQAKMLKKLEEFDQKLRDKHKKWINWESKKNHIYAIRHDNRLYPVKQIIHMATDIGLVGVGHFGGKGPGRANWFARELGFEIVTIQR